MDNVGNTAAFSPNNPQEDDMSKVREIFERTLNAIAQATELAKQVKQLSSDMDKLKSDFETTRDRNVELDRMLHDTREQRDRAERERLEAQDKAHSLEMNNSSLNQSNIIATETINKLRNELASTQKERDEYGLNAMSIQEALDKANDRLAQIHKTMGIEFKPFEVPKPEVKAEGVVVAKVTEHPYEAHPEPTEPHRVYKGDPDYVEYKAGNWDNDRGWWHWSNAA